MQIERSDNIPKMNLVCDWCGKNYQSYQCGKYHHFCSIECRRLAGKLVASSFDEMTRQNARERITYYNKNVLNQGEYKVKQADSLRGRGKKRGYIKRNGKHEHRLVVEEMLGRELTSEEIVHHIDGNKRNNSPDNLKVMTRSEHITEHLKQGGGKLAPVVQTSKGSLGSFAIK